MPCERRIITQRASTSTATPSRCSTASTGRGAGINRGLRLSEHLDGYAGRHLPPRCKLRLKGVLPRQAPTKFHHLARSLGNSRIGWRSKITSSPPHRDRFLVAGQSRAGQPRQVLARLDYSIPYGSVPKDQPITFDDVAGK